MSEYAATPDATLRLTDGGIELPEFLRGYSGAFTMRTANITGEYTTTDEVFYDGPLAVYPDDDGDYNSHLRAGLLSFETPDHREVVFEILDERTDGGEADE